MRFWTVKVRKYLPVGAMPLPDDRPFPLPRPFPFIREPTLPRRPFLDGKAGNAATKEGQEPTFEHLPLHLYRIIDSRVHIRPTETLLPHGIMEPHRAVSHTLHAPSVGK